MNLYTSLGARAALAALGLEKVARMVIPGMKFSPEAAHAMEQAGTSLFSGKALNPAALAKARTANAADAAAQAAQQQFRAAGAAHGPSSAQYIMSQEPAKLMQAGLTPQHLGDQGFMNAVAPRMLG